MGKQQRKSPNKLLCTPQRDYYAGLSCGCCCWRLQPDLVSQATRAGSAKTSSLLEPQYFPYCQPGNTRKTEPKEKKKRRDTDTEEMPESTCMKIDATPV